MKIALAQLNYRIGDFEGNISKIKASIVSAKKEGAVLVVFSELAVCGYPPKDFLDFDDFVDRCRKALLEIAEVCYGITAIVGAPTQNAGSMGKRLRNSAVVISDGNIQAEVHKTLLPNYDVFDEYRYFEPNRVFELVNLPAGKFAVTICEDLWNISDYPMYVQSPMEELIRLKPDAIINIAASPFHYRQRQERIKVLSRNAESYDLPVYYVNQVGAHTELIFDGGSMVIDSRGRIAAEMSYFSEDFIVFDTEKDFAITNPKKQPDKLELIYDALVMGIRDYFQKLGLNKAILGLSGGIDSALVLALAVKALGAENVKSLLLPSAFSSNHSIDDSLALLKNLGSPYEIISIENSFQHFLKDLKPFFGDLPFNIAEENIQARVRAIFLMAFSNKFGYILLNTSNKSEAAVGYGTLYGDMCGGLSVLGDVYKTEVFELARYINRDGEIIPENIIIKPPSAELRPNQKDADSLPEYDILDKILYEYIENFKGPDEITALGFGRELVERVLKMVNSNEWKRRQTPPTLRVSPKAFGFGRRIPVAAKYLL